MDFNPLDLLAAAALSDKESSSKSKGSECSGSGSECNTSEETESKDADDDSDKMGKSKSPSLNQPVKIGDIKPVCEMSPQKISWSPESFLSCLDKPSIDNDKLIIEQLTAGFVKDKLKCSIEVENKLNVTKDCNRQFKEDKVDKISSNEPNNVGIFINSIKEEKPPTNVSLTQIGDVSINKSVKVEIKDEPLSPTQSNLETFDSKYVKVEESLESGGQSDTDTAETSDDKPLSEELHDISHQESISLDHPYCLIPGKLRILSSDTIDEDIDVCSDSSPLTEDSEQRSRNFSLDCNYLKSGILEGKLVGTPQLHLIQTHHPKLSSPQKLSNLESNVKLSKTDPSAFKHVGVVSPERPGPSYGKYRIGTFASFSSSNLELEKYLKGCDSPPDKKLGSDIDNPSKLQHFTPSVQPLLQSPTLDWDRSEAGSETHDDSSDARTPHRLSPDFLTEHVTEWSHPMYHDHDYCAKMLPKMVSDDAVKLPLPKRKYTKKKNKLETAQHEKILKAKYLKKELLKDSFPKSTPSPLPDPSFSLSDANCKANPVGRPRKRPLEKSVDEEIDPETGAKMKITGKFQDQYVYYLSKSRTTSRRRQTPTLPLLTDKIIVPAPKPGDIIVPHLTDADIEIIRTKGRNALNLPGRPHIPHNIAPLSIKSTIPSSLPISHSSEFMSDEHIVSTILSMENDNLASPSSSQSHDFSQNSDLCNGQTPMNTESNITPEEQVLNYLLSVDDHSSSGLFPTLPPDPLYSKVDHLSNTDIINHNSLQNHSEILSSPSALENHLENSVMKSDTDGSNSLPDDLSAFISHSQLTTSSSTSQEFNSQCSVKSEFSSDLTPLGTPPSLTPSALKLTSIEKTLDYLGVKDGEIKLEPGELSSPKITHPDILPSLETPNTVIGDDDTPWIVTVTLYFNDVPAIIIFNEPYIRLVDIHKQILPAKDTGILKKRCQLLNIPVLNCTEMHRYFLVQYGKAYNSKSTLIISKNQATELVGYYASPQPRLARSEEATLRRRSDGSSMSPVTVTQESTSSIPSRKRGYNKSNKKSQPTSGLSSPDINVTDVKLVEEEPAQMTNGLNKRTRHKKINYLEMLRGEEKEKEKPPSDSILQAIESVLKSSTDTTIHNCKAANEKCPSNKSRSKKPIESKRHSTDKNKKEKKHDRRKSVDSDKKVKNSGKLLKTPKVKVPKIGKKDRLSTKESDLEKVLLMDAGEDFLNKSSNKNKPLKLKVNSLLNFSSPSHRKHSSSSPSSSSSSNLSKKGLFSCSNPTSSAPADHPPRVLAVAHQAAYSKEEGEARLPSQPADIHLDLFTKSSSACVRCHTCSQFLSVPHFMKHHHVAMDNEWLATEAAHRILVPRNKENISDEERRLWEEFHKLQESIGGFGEADDSDSDADSEEIDDTDYEMHDNPSSLETSGASYLSMDTSRSTLDVSYDSAITFRSPQLNTVNINGNVTIPHSSSKGVVNNSSHLISTAENCIKKHEPSVINSRFDSSISSGSNMSVLNRNQECTSTIRTSSRRRKSKQLFSIENYCTSPTKKGAEDEGNCHSISGPGGI